LWLKAAPAKKGPVHTLNFPAERALGSRQAPRARLGRSRGSSRTASISSILLMHTLLHLNHTLTCLRMVPFLQQWEPVDLPERLRACPRTPVNSSPGKQNRRINGSHPLVRTTSLGLVRELHPSSADRLLLYSMCICWLTYSDKILSWRVMNWGPIQVRQAESR
jgi:hypothetical protein